MTSSISGNATATFARTQPTDEMKAKIAADARALPSLAEVEAEAGKRQAEFETKRAEFDRQAKLIELKSLEVQKDSAIDMARLRDLVVAHYEKMATTSPAPAEKLEGAEAQRMLQVAKERAKQHGSPVPPPEGSRFGFFEGDFLYRVHPDGSITRQHKDVPTPEEHEEYAQIWREQQAIQARFVVENEAEIADLDKRKAELLSELGLTEDEWRALSKAGGNISLEV